MDENSSQNSFVRFVVPVALLITGVILMYFSWNQVSSVIGFGIYSVGGFSFAVIYNHARNPALSESSVIKLTQALVVYGGIIVALVYESLIPLETGLITISVAVFIFVLIAVIAEFVGINFSENTKSNI